MPYFNKICYSFPNCNDIVLYGGDSMFGDRLRKIRKQHGLTQRELADIMGLSTSTITKYEINERYPELDVLIKLADYFRVSLDYLFDRNISNVEVLSTYIATELHKRGMLDSADNDKKIESILNVIELLIKEFDKY
jgi:transcriptional regulator with XRE-family HTH domain